jgi:ATP/maltotriose-dependent transcriptional regulator MalT/DNA-binding SARP family transcriptional activator
VFARERLFHELDDNRSAACTWISGPPGAGKTALVASFACERALCCLWHQIDADDADPSAFFDYLIQGAPAALGGDAAKALPTCSSDATFSLPTFARQFFRELFALAPGLMLVLDDYHEAPLHCPLHDIVRAAIEQTPADAHITVLSRRGPPPAMVRAMAIGAVRQLTWEQLKLTAEEVAGIAEIHGVLLDERAAKQWLDRCGGWAAGLRLWLQNKTKVGKPVTGDEPLELLFDELGEEVFRKFPQALKSQLFALAVLSRIPAEADNEFACATTAQTELKALAEENLFTTVSWEGPATYCFHPLFRDFLLHRAERELPADSLRQIRLRAAEILLRRGETADAAQVLIEAQDWDGLCKIVLRQAPALVAQGRYITLGHWLVQLLPTHGQDNPWLHYWLGTCEAVRDPLTGCTSLERAFDLFAMGQDHTGMLLAWSGVVDCIVHQYADANPYGKWISRLEEMMACGVTFPTPEVEARVTFSMFVALSHHQPQHAEFSSWRTRLTAIANAASDPLFRMRARQRLLLSRVWSGDLRGAATELIQLESELLQFPHTPMMELIGLVSRATLALYRGETTACGEVIDKALVTAQASGVHVFDQILLSQGAALALSQGDLERGRMFSQRRAGLGNVKEQSPHHALEPWICWLSGRRADALAHVERSIECSKREDIPHFNAVELLGVAIVSFECGAQAAALSQVHDARALGVATRNPMILWMADLLEGYMRLCRGEEGAALIETSMTLGQEHGFRHFFFWPRHAVARVCLEALARRIHVDYAIELIDNGHLPAPQEAMDIERWPWSLKIFTLGRFSILVHGKPLNFDGKTQRGPLNLLKAVIALGGRDVAEHVLIDALWPEAAGDAGKQSLATTLSRLRKLIGKRAIKRQDGRLSLEPAQCWVDCWALERALGSNATSTSPEALGEKVRHLYCGRFLQADDDAPWALRLREHLHMSVLRRLNQVAQAALLRGDAELATRLYGVGLHVDDLVEDFYAGLIRCHAHRGQSSLAVTTYHLCQRVLGTRLGVTPSNQTTLLYLAAIEGKTAMPLTQRPVPTIDRPLSGEET